MVRYTLKRRKHECRHIDQNNNITIDHFVMIKSIIIITYWICFWAFLLKATWIYVDPYRKKRLQDVDLTGPVNISLFDSPKVWRHKYLNFWSPKVLKCDVTNIWISEIMWFVSILYFVNLVLVTSSIWTPFKVPLGRKFHFPSFCIFV